MKLRLRHRLGSLGRSSLDLLFPPRCAHCDCLLLDRGDRCLLCDSCQNVLGPVAWRCCPRCGAVASPQVSPLGGCTRCSDRRLWFDRVVPLGAYRDQLRLAVLAMKHRTGDPLSAAVAELYAKRRGPELAATEADLLVAVPMYWTRRLVRGTNSPEIVARHLAPRIGVPAAGRILVRSRNTLPQKDLSPGQRFRNVRGAFRLRAGYDLRGVKVLIVDDILTTGATCGEVARVLKNAGAAMVVAAVIARAEGNG